MSPAEGPGTLDLDRLMADLKARVAARRAAGEYDPRLLDLPFDEDGDAFSGLVRLRLQTAYSSKPVVGPAITAGKRGLIRLLFHFLNDVVMQVNSALTGLRSALEAETRAREELEERIRLLEARLAADAPRGAGGRGRAGPDG